MEAAGYDVTIQPYTFTYSAYVGTPTWSEVSPTARTTSRWSTDWNPGQSNGTRPTRRSQPAGGIVIPPTPTPSSTSGCTAADFSGFTPGRIALIQRGGCNFGVKVLNAQAAGAIGRGHLQRGQPRPHRRLSAAAWSTPTATRSSRRSRSRSRPSTSARASTTSTRRRGTPPRHEPRASTAIVDPNRDDWNVIAESKGGDPNHVVVVDAHLDAIYGAGHARQRLRLGDDPRHRPADEERPPAEQAAVHLVRRRGARPARARSTTSTTSSTTELSHIGYDLDADVTATPNYLIGVLDPAGPDLFSRTVSATFPQPACTSRRRSRAT